MHRTGLNDSVFHGNNAYNSSSLPNPNPNAGLTDATFGGNNAAIASVAAYAASNTPNYTFVNSYDRFVYSGGSTTTTAAFLANGVYGGTGDAAGQALTDPADVDDTIFDAEGYFHTPSANDAGTYSVRCGGGRRFGCCLHRRQWNSRIGHACRVGRLARRQCRNAQASTSHFPAGPDPSNPLGERSD